MTHLDAPVTLRPLSLADGPVVAALGAATRSTTSGAVQSHISFHPSMVSRALEAGEIGVVAETPGYDGIVGMGWMRTGECWYEAALWPYAYLYNGVVHPAYRRRGILRQMTAWRLAMAREQAGPELVAYALVSQGNLPSLAAGRRWSEQTVEGRIVTALAPMRGRPPRQMAGIEVRPVVASDLSEYRRLEDDAYRQHNFYPPHSGGPLGIEASKPDAEGWVAVERGGGLVAGLVARETGRLSPVRIERMAWPARIANLFLRLIPSDGVVRPIRVRHFWCAPGREAAAAHLWEAVRWRWRERGSMITAMLDVRSPLARALPLPRLIPRRPSALFVAGPTPLQPSRPIYVQHL